jgi:hypothetical protein
MKTEQFSLRQMLKAMLVVAAVSAIAAPFLRKFSAEELSWMGAALGTGAITFGLTIMLLAAIRRRCEAAAGTRLLQFERPSTPSSLERMALPFFAAIELLIIAGMPLVSAGNHFLMIANLFTAFFMPFTIAVQWWHSKERKREMCENGIVVDGRWYIPWKQVKYYAWVKTTELKIACKNQRIYVKIPRHQRGDAESLLSAKVPSTERVDIAGGAKN